MLNRVDGKVAFITGAARGQGRSHAVRLAAEGADIIAVDICEAVESNVAPAATEQDLAETVRQVEAQGKRMIATKADVRDFDALQQAVKEGVAELGRLDVVIANAGSWTYGLSHELSETEWRETIDISLTGVWQTCRAAIPTMIDQGTGGSIIITSSVLGLQASPHMSHYVAAKHGAVGLMKTLALELAPHRIRVNTVNPGTVNTDLVMNAPTFALFAPDLESPTTADIAERMAGETALPVPWVEVQDVTNAVLFLASDESRYVTGISLPVDAGILVS